MTIKTPKFKTILKRILYALLILALFVSAWIAFAIYHDESPDIGRDEFYALSPKNVPDNQNTAVAISGINAPVGTDIFKQGRFAIDTFFRIEDGAEAKKIVDAAGGLAFVGNSNEFDCWLDYPIEEAKDNCASAKRIKSLLVENKELLARYASLADIPSYSGATTNNGQILINLNRLLAAEIKLDIEEGNSELAYDKWLKNHLIINHIFKNDSTAIEHAIYLVIDGFNLYSLENLLLKSPEIGIKHFEELSTILKSNGLERYNLKGMLRADYAFASTELFKKHNQKLMQTQKLMQKHLQKKYLHPEFIRNRFYRAQIDLLNSAQKPPATYSASAAELYKKHGEITFNVSDYYWLDPLNSLLSRMLSGGFIKSLSLVSSMHAKNALINALNLSLQIKQQKIAPSNIQAFLNRAGKQYDCPFTSKPMQFEKEKNVLFCDNPESVNRAAEVRL